MNRNQFAKNQTRRTPLSHSDWLDFLCSGWIFGRGDGRVSIGWGHATWFSEAELGRFQMPESVILHAPDFYLKDRECYLLTEFWTSFSDKAEFLQALSATTTSSPLPEPNWREPDQAEFQNRFQKIMAAFAAGESEKVVPVVFATADMTILPLQLLITSLVHLATSAVRVYGVWQNVEGLGQGILGATPETLFSVQDGMLQTMALAGTLPKPATPQRVQEFLTDPKELREHELVVASLQATLSNLGTVTKEPLRVLELPHLFHLQTRMQARLNAEVSFADLIRWFHPTPALGVSPTKLGLDYLQRFEGPRPRQRFGAPFSLLTQDSAGLQVESLVAIRNIQWTDANNDGEDSMASDQSQAPRRIELILGSGCGIVSASQFEREWIELKAKRNSVLKLFGMEPV